MRLWKNSAIMLAGWLAPLAALAEVKLEVRLDNDAVLQYESAYVFVGVMNDTDLALDAQAEDPMKPEFRFVIEKRADEPLPLVNKTPLVTKLRIRPSETKQFVIDLAAFYDLTGEGKYSMHLELVWRGRLYKSNTQLLDVVPGVEILHVNKSLLGYEDRVRTYSVRYWTRKGAEYLFLRVDDKENGMNYGVFQLGSLNRFTKPTIDVDRLGNVTVVHQASAECFMKSSLKAFRDRVEFTGQTLQQQNGNPYPYTTPR